MELMKELKGFKKFKKNVPTSLVYSKIVITSCHFEVKLSMSAIKVSLVLL